MLTAFITSETVQFGIFFLNVFLISLANNKYAESGRLGIPDWSLSITAGFNFSSIYLYADSSNWHSYLSLSILDMSIYFYLSSWSILRHCSASSRIVSPKDLHLLFWIFALFSWMKSMYGDKDFFGKFSLIRLKVPLLLTADWSMIGCLIAVEGIYDSIWSLYLTLSWWAFSYHSAFCSWSSFCHSIAIAFIYSVIFMFLKFGL